MGQGVRFIANMLCIIMGLSVSWTPLIISKFLDTNTIQIFSGLQFLCVIFFMPMLSLICAAISFLSK